MLTERSVSTRFRSLFASNVPTSSPPASSGTSTSMARTIDSLWRKRTRLPWCFFDRASHPSVKDPSARAWSDYTTKGANIGQDAAPLEAPSRRTAKCRLLGRQILHRREDVVLGGQVLALQRRPERD